LLTGWLYEIALNNEVSYIQADGKTNQ
jgi:hypothetical protein